MDNNLLTRLRNQQPEALEDMMEIYHKLVSTIIYNVLGRSASQADVEELVSDTFYAVWNHAGSIRDGNLKAYLSMTARNRAKSHLRRKQPLPMDIDELDLPDPASPPEAAAMEQERNRLVRKAINQMRPTDREIFLRYYYYLQSTNEIAERMHMHPSTVRTRLTRGRKALQKTLNKEVLF